MPLLQICMIAAIALIVLAQIGGAIWLGCLYRSQSRLIRLVLEEAERSANASRDALNGSSDTEIRQLRAYIGVHQSEIEGLESSDRVSVRLSFVNYGQTPATKFNMVGAIDLLPYPLPENFILLDPPSRPPYDGIIFPKETNQLTAWVFERAIPALSTQTKQKIFSLDTNEEIYAHGTVTYEDIFGKVRTTKFCFVLNPKSVKRNQAGAIIPDAQGHPQFQFAPVAGRNALN
jgi:hypothetical protein